MVFFGFSEKRRCADGGYRFAKSFFVRRNHAKMQGAEIAHGASRCADIQRITRAHQHDVQIFELNSCFQQLPTTLAIVCELACPGTFGRESAYLSLRCLGAEPEI
jgi:hypothetical protein